MRSFHRIIVSGLLVLLSHCVNAQNCFWKLISAKNHHTLAIKSDGTLWGWGNNEYGQLGDGSTINKNSPVQIGNENKWIQIATGYNHSYGIKSDGTLWSWGNNYYGQLGDKSYIDKTSPVRVGTDSNWIYISSGWHHGIAVKSNGTIWGWGLNNYGQVGDGSVDNKNQPTQVGSDNTWSLISCGNSHSIALKSNGSLWAWGLNSNGQIGDGTNVEKHIPTQETSGSSWKKIITSSEHNLGIKSDNTLWAWGSNYSGQLGDGTKTSKLSPVQIGLPEWKNIATGEEGSLGIKSDGTLWGWGSDQYGQIGDGSSVGKRNPVQVGVDNNWANIFSGSFHSLGLKSDGTFWAWGNNDLGEVGDGTNVNKYYPTQIANGNCISSNLFWIPDGNLRLYLKNQYPACFTSSDYLNTDCANNAAINSILISGKQISNLDGIQYFSNLTSIDCRSNNLTYLPALPPALNTFISSQNCFCSQIPNRPVSFPASGTWQITPNKVSCTTHLSLPISPIVTDINTPTTLLIGKAIYFNGTNSHIDFPSFAMAESPVTIEFWAKPEVSNSSKSVILNIGGANGIIISKPDAINNLNSTNFTYGSGGDVPVINVPESSNWNHYAFTCTGKAGTYNFYLNGELIKSGNLSNLSISLSGLIIGSGNTLTDFYKGYLHDMRIWKKVRTQDEIVSTINSFNDFTNNDLIGAYKLNEGNGFVPKDYSTKNIGGSISNCSWGDIDNQAVYAWSPGTYLSGSSGQNVNFNSSVPNNYSYTITASKQGSCQSSQTISITAKNNIGRDFASPIQIGNLNYGANYSNTQNNSPSNGFRNDVGQPSDDIFYSFTISQSSNVTISHCNSGLSDTYLHLFNSSRTLINSNDDYGPSCQNYRASLTNNLAPGTYYIASEGYNLNAGDITTEVKVQECVSMPGTNYLNPIVISNNIGSCFSYNDVKNNAACYGNDYGQPSEDIFYKFTLNSTQTVTISNCGSEITDSYMTLLDANGNYFDSNDDSPNCSASLQSYLKRDLPAGTYYIVEEGYGSSSGFIKVTFKTGTNCRTEDPEVSNEKNPVNKELEIISTSISLFPNPANGVVTLNIPDNNENTLVAIKDISGKIVQSIQTSSILTEINTSELNSGMYYVSFQYNNRIENLKLQITK